MGCKPITTAIQPLNTFSLDKIYDEDYTLQQIYKKFTQLSKDCKNQKRRTLELNPLIFVVDDNLVFLNLLILSISLNENF